MSYKQAMAFRATGDVRHAQTAVSIIDAWSINNKQFGLIDQNGPLEARHGIGHGLHHFVREQVELGRRYVTELEARLPGEDGFGAAAELPFGLAVRTIGQHGTEAHGGGGREVLGRECGRHSEFGRDEDRLFHGAFRRRRGRKQERWPFPRMSPRDGRQARGRIAEIRKKYYHTARVAHLSAIRLPK